MLEIEMKFAVDDFAPTEARLQAWGARPAQPIDEADHYFNAPDRDFGKTDEAFRMRRIGELNHVTYKGPKLAGPAKTRLEIEVGLEPGNEAAQRFGTLLERLGYRPTAIVRKRRAVYHHQRQGFDLQFCLDQVDRVGKFIEIEIVARPEDREAAERVLLELAQELGLTRHERRSYLAMTLGLAEPGAAAPAGGPHASR